MACGRAAALALALVALIGALAVLRVAPDLRAWWNAAPGSDDALLAHVFLFELNLPRVAMLVPAPAGVASVPLLFACGLLAAVCAIALVGTPLMLAMIRRGATLSPGGAIVFAGVSAGPEWVTPARWWAALAGHDPVARMLIDLRMPRLLCATLRGLLGQHRVANRVATCGLSALHGALRPLGKASRARS
nr:hypothetical protein [Burkholderia pseudomallei]